MTYCGWIRQAYHGLKPFQQYSQGALSSRDLGGLKGPASPALLGLWTEANRSSPVGIPIASLAAPVVFPPTGCRLVAVAATGRWRRE